METIAKNNIVHLPPDLIQTASFCCWQYEQREGKLTKVPYNPRTGTRAESNNRDTFAPFNIAYAEADRYSGLGVGVFDNLCAVDIDHCISEDGTISDMAQDIINTMDAYTEKSPSGTGIRILFTAPGFTYDRDAYFINNQKIGLEVYAAGCTKKYVTVTGDIHSFKRCDNLFPRGSELQTVLDKYMRRDEKKRDESSTRTEKTAPPVIGQDWRTLLQIGLENSESMRTAYNLPPDESRDDSKDDYALCKELAYWLNANPAAMRAAFLESARGAREKGRYNLNRTINAAIRDTRSTAAQGHAEYMARNTIQPAPNESSAAASLTVPAFPEIPPPSKKKKVIACFDCVPFEEPHFLIHPYIMRGKINIIQGDSGTGKTALACKLAAVVSTGGRIINNESESGNVLMLSVEDDPSTLKGRIEASGGDLSKCFLIEEASDLNFNSPEIEAAIKEYSIKMLIFDPLQAFLGGRVDMNRANETRPILARLAEMARRNDCAVVIVSHLNKGLPGVKAIHRALGSVDIVAASRSVLYVGRDPENDESCVVCHIKSSNARTGSSFTYHIGDRGGVKFDGYSALTSDDLQRIAARKEKGVDYGSEPIVIGVRKFFTDNPKGGKITYDDFSTLCMKESGIAPYSTNREAYSKIAALKAEIMRTDKILIETGAYVAAKRDKGISITPYTPPKDFQTDWSYNQDATETQPKS